MIKKNIICINKKAKFEYFIKDVFFSGIVLKGWEVKSLRKKKVDINHAYVSFIKNELFLINSIINPLSTITYDTVIEVKRNRKLLLKKKEIKNLSFLFKKKKFTFIALSLFWKRSWCKLKFSWSKGKSKFDKREQEKKNNWKKEKLFLQKEKYKYNNIK